MSQDTNQETEKTNRDQLAKKEGAPGERGAFVKKKVVESRGEANMGHLGEEL